jgi:transcription elongation factor GreB
LHIVGPDELDLRANKISIDAPIARALLGKQVDDEIQFSAPAGIQYRVITDISYDLLKSPSPR